MGYVTLPKAILYMKFRLWSRSEPFKLRLWNRGWHMPFSLHSHSGQFCKHAVGSLEEVVLEAIKQGFAIYGLTEHVPRYRLQDLYPDEVLYFPSLLLLFTIHVLTPS